MELRTLRYFVTVVREGSITAAAKSLHVTQPTLSRQLAALEDELGHLLYQRNRKGIELTEQGVILRRYATTRRPHPLEREGMGLEEAMREERRRLVKVRDSADIVLDTSRFTLHDLRREIQRRWSETETAGHAMRVNLISFGFKYGVPSEADMVFDLRCLPNPYFVEELRPLTGQNRAVADYVFAGEAARAFRERFLDFLRFALPYYDAEGRYRLTIGLGCTGGRHRSVAMTEAAAKALRQDGYVVGVEHRHSSLDHFQNENAPTERVQKTQGSAVAD